MTADKKELYAYHCRKGIIYSAQKRPNGNIVYVTSNGSLVEIDKGGNELTNVALGANAGWFTVEALAGGRCLVPQPTAGGVAEIDAGGKTVLDYRAPNVNAATKLTNGNLLVCRHANRTIAEVDRTGKVLWEQKIEGRPFAARRR